MQYLDSKIRSDLNRYQAQVATQLQHFKDQGLISEVEVREIIGDARITAQAIIEGLSYQNQYTKEATEIYIYSLFDRYKGNIDKKIRKIEEKQKSKQIHVNRKSIVVCFEDEIGRLIEPSLTDIEILENYLEEVLTIRVQSLVVVVGFLNRMLKLNVISQDSNLFFRLKAKLYNKKIDQDKYIIESTYKDFGQCISQIVDSNYSEDEKQKYQSGLIYEMKNKVIEKRKSGIQKKQI